MTKASIVPRQVRDQQDVSFTLGAGTDGYAIVYNHGTGLFTLGTFEAAGAVATHVGLSDPHTQYELESNNTAAAILTKLLTVDGAGSLLDADFLDGNSSAAFLLATGATTGATSQAQTFTNGIKSPSVQAISDSTTHGWKNAAGTNVLTVDTINGRLGIGVTPSYGVDISNSGAGYTRMSNTSTGAFTSSGFILANTECASGHEQVIVLFQKDSAGSATGTSSFQLRKRNAANTEVATHLSITGAGDVLLNAGTTAGTALVQGNVGVGVTSPTAKLHVAASTTARASVCLPHGSAPTSPVNGDMWTTTANIFARINGTTRTVASGVTGAAFTQTYSTADRTISAYTADSESGAYSGIDNAQGGSVYAQLTDLNALRTAYENLRAFTEDIAQALNALIDDAQAFSISG